MSEEVIKEIKEWKVPKNVKEVQSFLGFANFYCRFIMLYSKICVLLTDLTKKGMPWKWIHRCEAAFKHLKEKFTSTPILAHFHHEHQKHLETDASDLAKGSMLSQLEPDGR